MFQGEKWLQTLKDFVLMSKKLPFGRLLHCIMRFQGSYRVKNK